jgi:hypothetical protein
MKYLFYIMIICSFSSLGAQVTPAHVESMLAQMVKENVISKTEADKVRAKVSTMTSEKWNQINKKASSIAARSPSSEISSNNKIEEVKSIDLDGAQFKTIQNEMNRIIPELKDR